MSDEVLRDFLSAHSLAHLAPALLDEELTVRLLRTMSNVSSCLAEIGIGEADAQALARALADPASASSSTAATDEACCYRVAPGPGSRVVAPPAPLPAGSRRLALDEDFPGLRRVHASPPVYLVEGFLPAAECAALTRTGVPLLLRSRTDGGVSAGRTSDSIFLTSGCADACAPSLLARVRRLFLGLPRSRMEEPQLARYGAGQRYTEHYDTPTTGPELEQAGHAAGPGLRLATVLVYLTSLASGGRIEF